MSHLPDITSTMRQAVRMGDSMAISHELSSEIATALFAAKERSPDELDELKQMVWQIHSALEESTVERHTTRHTSAAAAAASAGAATPSTTNSNESV